jgi:hypothetical protein
LQHPRSIIPGLVVLAMAGSLAAGCSSSSSPASTASNSAAATSASASAATDALPAADCAIIKPIAADAATSLAPVQTEPTAQAATTMATYITTLSEALANLTSTQGKADLGAFIDDLKSASAANADKIEAAIQKLATDCP